MTTWSEETVPSPYHGFVAAEMNDNLSGPFKYPQLVAVTNMPDSGMLVGVSNSNNVMYTDLEKMRDVKFDSVGSEPFDTAVHDGGNKSYVVANADGEFSYYGRNVASPFAESVEGGIDITNALFFDNAYLSIAETGPMHLKSEHEMKQLHEIVFSFKPNSVGHLWCYAQNEEGLIKGQYKGSIYGKPRVKVFMNLRGREFKMRMFMATSISYPWQIQEVALGHLIGKGSI